MINREVLQKLKEFECQRCDLCCRQPGFVYVTPEETEEIARFLGVDIYDFVNQYCELFDRRKLVLKKYEEESCIFLTAVQVPDVSSGESLSAVPAVQQTAGGGAKRSPLTKNGCSIYPARPQQCRDFPIKWNTPRSFDYCAGLKALA